MEQQVLLEHNSVRFERCEKDFQSSPLFVCVNHYNESTDLTVIIDINININICV